MNLLTRLQNHRLMMAPHQKERHAGKLLLEAEAELRSAAADNLELLELLRECERALAMVPATAEPIPGFLAELQRSTITPLMDKIRAQFA